MILPFLPFVSQLLPLYEHVHLLLFVAALLLAHEASVVPG